MATRKTVFARVSNPNGTLLAHWFNIDFQGFTKTLNGGIGECVLRYAVPFDYDGADLVEGNDVELILRDADTVEPGGGAGGVRTIYRGYISLVVREIDGNSERVAVHLLGYYTLLALDVLKDGAQTTLYSKSGDGLTTTSGSQSDADIGLMARTIIDRFNAENTPGRVFYELSDVPNTGTTAEYTFLQKTYREAIDSLKSLAPENVYWYVDETGRFHFEQAPGTPTHTFVLGRHVSNVRVERSLEKLRNVGLISSTVTGVYKNYEDAASIAEHGRRVERVSDYGITDDNAADAAGAKFLAENSQPSIKIIATIVDNNSEATPSTYVVDPGGTDLVTNGGFDGDADDWSLGAFWSWSAGTLLHEPDISAGDEASQGIGAEYGKSYLVTLYIGGTTGTLAVALGQHDLIYSQEFAAGSGTQTFTLVCGDGSHIRFFPSGDFDGYVDNVRVVELTDYTLGTELVENGAFTGDADGWNLGSDWSYNSDHIDCVDDTGNALYQEYLEPNDLPGYFEVSLDVTGTTGAVEVYLADLDPVIIPAGSGTYSFTAGVNLESGNNLIRIYPEFGTGFDGTIDNVSIRQRIFSEPRTVTLTQITGTDIEDIHPGDTCRFLGFSSTLSDIFRDNMLITSVRYTLNAVEIEVELTKSGFVDIQSKHQRQIAEINTGGLGIPESYT